MGSVREFSVIVVLDEGPNRVKEFDDLVVREFTSPSIEASNMDRSSRSPVTGGLPKHDGPYQGRFGRRLR